MKRVAGMLLIVMSCSGCIYTLRGDGEMGFKQESTWSFYHGTDLDQEGEKKSIMEMRGSGFDWLMDIFTPADAPEEVVDNGTGSGS